MDNTRLIKEEYSANTYGKNKKNTNNYIRYNGLRIEFIMSVTDAVIHFIFKTRCR